MDNIENVTQLAINQVWAHSKKGNEYKSLYILAQQIVSGIVNCSPFFKPYHLKSPTDEQLTQLTVRILNRLSSIKEISINIACSESKPKHKYSLLSTRTNHLFIGMIKGSQSFELLHMDPRTEKQLALSIANKLDHLSNIKELAIKKIWTDTRQGDSYRSLSIMIDNRINTIANNHPYFSWYSLDILTDQKIADLIINSLSLSPKNRKIISQIENRNGMKRSYSDIQYLDTDIDDDLDPFFFDILEDKGIDPFKIFEPGNHYAYTLAVFNFIIHEVTPETCKISLYALRKMNLDLFHAVDSHSKSTKSIGLEWIDFDALQEYAFLADAAFIGVFLFVILNELKIQKSQFSFHAIADRLKIEEAEIKGIAENVDKRAKQLYDPSWIDAKALQKKLPAREIEALREINKYFNIDNITGERKLDVLTTKHRLHLGFRAFCDECTIISGALKKEMNEAPDLFAEQSDDTSETGWREYLSGERHIFNFEDKLNTINKLLEYASNHNNIYFDHDSRMTLKIIFQELFVRNSVVSPSDEQSASTIVKNIISDQIETLKVQSKDKTALEGSKAQKSRMNTEEMKRIAEVRKKVFLDEKFIRGYFCAQNMSDVYPHFLELRNLYRNCILSALSIHDQMTALENISILIYNFLTVVIRLLCDRITFQADCKYTYLEYLAIVRTLVPYPKNHEVDSYFPYKSISHRLSK